MIRTAFLETIVPWCDDYENKKKTEYQIHYCLHLHSRIKLGNVVNLSEIAESLSQSARTAFNVILGI